MDQQASRQPVKSKLLDQILALEESDTDKIIKTRARRTKIRTEFVGSTLAVFNGWGYTKVRITEEMIGRTLAKVVPRETATARMRFLSIPPRKMRQVADLVQGLPVEKALNILNFTPKIAAHHMAKTLKSAVANKLSLEGTSNLNPEDLYIKRIAVDAGPTAKRIRFQSMGRVFRYRKRFCHLSIFLGDRPEAKTAEPTRATATRTKTAKKTAMTKTSGIKAKSEATRKKKKSGKAAEKASTAGEE